MGDQDEGGEYGIFCDGTLYRFPTMAAFYRIPPGDCFEKENFIFMR